MIWLSFWKWALRKHRANKVLSSKDERSSVTKLLLVENALLNSILDGFQIFIGLTKIRSPFRHVLTEPFTESLSDDVSVTNFGSPATLLARSFSSALAIADLLKELLENWTHIHIVDGLCGGNAEYQKTLSVAPSYTSPKMLSNGQPNLMFPSCQPKTCQTVSVENYRQSCSISTKSFYGQRH